MEGDGLDVLLHESVRKAQKSRRSNQEMMPFGH